MPQANNTTFNWGSFLGGAIGAIGGGATTGGSGAGLGSTIGSTVGGAIGGLFGSGTNTNSTMYNGRYNFWKDVPNENKYGFLHGGWGKVWEDWHNSQDYTRLKPELMRKAAAMGDQWVLDNVGKGSGVGGTHTAQDWEYVAWKAIDGQAPLNNIDGKNYEKLLLSSVPGNNPGGGSGGQLGLPGSSGQATTTTSQNNGWIWWAIGGLAIIGIVLAMSSKPVRRYARRTYARARNSYRRSTGYQRKRSYRSKRRW